MRGELHVYPGRGAVLCLWYPEVQDHSLPRTVQRPGGAFPSDTISHDWQVITPQEGSRGATPTGAPAGLQQHLVGGDQLFATLSDVWEASVPPYQLLFPNGECLQVLPSHDSICHRGLEMLQGSLHRGLPPDKLRGRETEMLL